MGETTMIKELKITEKQFKQLYETIKDNNVLLPEYLRLKKRIDEFVKKYMTDDNIYLTEVVKSMNLTETKLSRVWQHATDPKSSFGMVSAYINPDKYGDESIDEKNKKRHIDLYTDIQNLGRGYIELKGGYTHKNGKFVEEKSYMIPNIKKEDLFKLMKKYEQESVIYKNGLEFDLFDNEEKILMSFNKEKDGKGLSFDKEKFKEYYSSLVRGPHKGRKFLFSEICEREPASFNRIAYIHRPLDWYIIS